MQIDVARGIAAKIWCEQNHRRKVMDKDLCESMAHLLVDEIEKAKLDIDPTIKQARAAYAKAFKNDPYFRKTYEANIAEAILSDQMSESPANLSTRADCNVLADELIKRVFES